MVKVGTSQVGIRQIHFAQIRKLQRVGIDCRKQFSMYVLYLYHFKCKSTK